MIDDKRRRRIRELSQMDRNDLEELRVTLTIRREKGDQVGFELNLVLAMIAFLWP